MNVEIRVVKEQKFLSSKVYFCFTIPDELLDRASYNTACTNDSLQQFLEFEGQQIYQKLLNKLIEYGENSDLQAMRSDSGPSIDDSDGS